MRKFEKNIQSKANAFEMNPMPGSFDKVMKALEEKKKKRFILWLWIVIPGLLIAGSGIWMLNLYNNDCVKSNTIAQNNTATNPNNIGELKTIQQNEKQTTYTNKDDNTTRLPKENVLNDNDVVHKTSTQNNTQPVSKNKSSISKTTNTSEKKLGNTTLETTHINNNTINNDNSTFVPNHTIQNMVVLAPKRNKELFVLGYPNNPINIYSLKNNIYSAPHFTFRKINYPPIIFSQKHSRFSLGVYSDLGVSKSVITDNKNDSISSPYTQARNQNDIFLFSYSAGLQFRYSPIKNLAIETGIGFTHYTSNQLIMDANISMSTADLENFPDTAITLFNTNTISKNYANMYEYISIPVKLYYQNKWNWIGFEAGGGVIFDIPVNTRSYVTNENNGYSYYENTIDKSRLNKFGVQVSANANIVFHIKKVGIFAGPTFKYRVNSMFDDNYIIKQHNYFIGGTLGVRYNF